MGFRGASGASAVRAATSPSGLIVGLILVIAVAALAGWRRRAQRS